ncbi:MAG: RagB/SusD family nutrient uptake outer membrane protein [Bacteroides sp.]|uniref:RagB/SusD family nutrient uptake outer membrane protein n=1 Tax=Bacteroides sp. TaxID=29523 RepID=UPI001B4BA60F|nr:RagB/SusD family nutrient uptake outer membrane protein [Bacteroides sp.]MBP6065917.1 RagB/SusD family nutrient uptake outer membrane protein [Bacteroides sp.]MBP6526910.1 RagB/SusD family nutrient uptake outer membrane protein [Prevotella sp.]
MKYIKKLILSAAACTLLASSCTFDVLDDNPYYMGDSADQIFSDPKKISAAAVGMYDALQNAEYLGGRTQIYVDSRGLDVNPPTYFGPIANFNPTANNSTIENAWQGAYRTIYECNLFLQGIDGALASSIITQEEYNGYAAEAKFIRSIVYFYTLNLWGQMYVAKTENLGVPLILIPYDGGSAFTDAPKNTRSTINQCYDQIISDLTYAEENLKPNWGDDDYSNRARATKSAAQAMLSRVYLYTGDYDKVIANADKLIPSADGGAGKYALDLTVVDVFASPTSSSEIIFFVAMNSADNPNTNNALGQHYGASGRADITVSEVYQNLLSAKDTRKTKGLLSKDGAVYCNKYQKKSFDWAPIIRYAEVMLNKAEALVKKNKQVDATAVKLLSSVHSRSDADKTYTTADFATSEQLLEEILLERRRELAFEGHASFDLFRNKKGISAGRGGAIVPAIDYPSDYFALPIPSSDVEKAGGLLVQNNGY